jgi:DNA polymerase epsilon subunit 1
MAFGQDLLEIWREVAMFRRNVQRPARATAHVPLAERAAEIDRMDAVFGYEKLDELHEGDRVGWLTNMRTVMLEKGDDAKELSAVEYYFLAPDGSGFKCTQPHEAYFYIAVSEGHASDVDSSLRRRFAEQIKDIRHVHKEDLELPNHLSGKRKLYLQLLFRNTRDLMEVRRLLLPAVQKNRAKSSASAVYSGEGSLDAASASSRGPRAAAAAIGASTSRSSDGWLDRIEGIREFDVPYHQRVAIDTGRRVGKWYYVRDYGRDQPPTLTFCAEREAFGEPRVLAFDIECVKQPLKFPDSKVDPIMMISYMIDGIGFLIINREVVSEDIADFEYTPKSEFPGPFTVFNETDEGNTLRKFCAHMRELHPHVVVTYNGDSFDWPYINTRCELLGIDLKRETGFAPSTSDSGQYFLSSATTHIDCIHWVRRDSYLPAGSHGLKAVCRAKLGYDPLEIDPEDMTRFAVEQPQLMSSYSVSDAVATYYLYMKYVHGFIFSLSTVIPMTPDEVLRRGSGTLCESLLMVEAYRANVICPNKQVDDVSASHDGHLLESETYVGGHVECLQTGIYRDDIPVKFKLKASALQGLLDRLDETLDYQIWLEGLRREEITNYGAVRAAIAEKLETLRDNPTRSEEPVIYHLDVGAMYPNIILTNRLQPPAIVTEQTCAACVHNQPESDCKRPLKWMWRGQVFPASLQESDMVRATLEYENVPNPEPGAPPIAFLELDPETQNKRFRQRLKEYCQKAFAKAHVTKSEEKTAVTCQRENPFYIDTVRAFRDRRYEYKRLNKTWAKKRQTAEVAGDASALMEAKAMCVLYDSLQLAHKCILNSFYGYVMRRGARWYSMEMAGVVTYTGAAIIKEARALVEGIGKTLELDTDGIWCVFPRCFPQDFTLTTNLEGKSKVSFSYPCTMLNVDVDRTCANPQYQRLDVGSGMYSKQREQSIFFEVDGPYKAMILPASTEEGKLLKKRYAVFELDGKLAELKGFELKRRGELKLIKVFQTEVFGEGSDSPFLKGEDLASCYAKVAEVADRWVDVLDSRGADMEDEELLELVSEQKSMSKALEDYGEQKSTAITVARRLAEFLGDQMVRDANLACKYIISYQPATAPVTERAIPVAIFDAEIAVKAHYLRRWLKDRSLDAGNMDLRSIIDWSYYRSRLDAAIQKIITVPAALQQVPNPVPRVKHPDWLHAMVRKQNDTHQQASVKDMFQAALARADTQFDLGDLAGLEDRSECGRQHVVHRRSLSASVPQSSLAPGPPGNSECPGTERLDATHPAQAGIVSQVTDLITLHGSADWLAKRKCVWRALRTEKKRLRRDQEQRERSTGARSGGGQAMKRARGGLGSFYADQALTVNNAHWQVLTVKETPNPGEFSIWVMISDGLDVATLHQIPVVVPRQLYVNVLGAQDAPRWVKVSRTLPRGAPSLFTYEVSMPESEFIDSASDMAKWLHHKDVCAVYHTHTTPLLQLITHIGCCCHVARGVPRRSPHEGFALHELRQSADQDAYLSPPHDRHTDSDKAGSAKLLVLYAAGSASRGVVSVCAAHARNGVLILIRPRGSTTSADARTTVLNHPAAVDLTLTLEAASSWAEAFARVGIVLQAMRSASRRPIVALAQSRHDVSSLQELIPQLKQLPTISVPHNRADAARIDDGSLALGGAWQPRALELALDRYMEMAPWWARRVDMARYAGIPVGCLPADASAFAIDVLMHRRLLHSGHLSWLSPSPLPDLGGQPALSTDGGGAEEIPPPEIMNPGMYRRLCIELQLDNLAVDTILEMRHVHTLEGIDLGKDMVRSAATSDSAASAAALGSGGHGGDDSSIAAASALRVLRLMLSEWMRSVLHEGDTRADLLLMNINRWLCSSASLLYDPAVHRMVQLLMKKVWMQLLAEVRSLGAVIVHASFTRLTIATDKMSLADGQAYVGFLLSSLSTKPIFSFLRLTPLRFWSSLLYLDTLNFGGLAQETQSFMPPPNAPGAHDAGIDNGEIAADIAADNTASHIVGEADQEMAPARSTSKNELSASTWRSIGDARSVKSVSLWNIAFHLPPMVQERFLQLIKLYVAEPWMLAAMDAEAQGGRSAPTQEATERKAISFFNDFFSMKVLEEVDRIRRTLPSTGSAERRALLDGTASDEVIARSFPHIPGSFLNLSDPALEFVKQVCHLCSLEPCIEEQLHNTRKNALRMLKVDEFAHEGVWANPSISFVVPEVVCEFCGHCRDLDLCRDEHWACGECENPYEPEAIESDLVKLAQRRALAFQLQDVQCAKCKAVKRSNLSPFCQKCAGPFELRRSREGVERGLSTFARIASDHGMPWLAETVSCLQAGKVGDCDPRKTPDS